MYLVTESDYITRRALSDIVGPDQSRDYTVSPNQSGGGVL